ncbi:MAG: ATP12 family protein [Erythrobacter sp.]
MKRFYKDVTVRQAEGGWQLALDGRALKTQGRRQQIAPSRALADALATEWDAQGEELDPASFTYRDLTDYALDIVAADPAAMVETLVKYAETDTLCYRAEPEDALFARQQSEWEPILTSVEAREGVRFTRVSGIMHQAQPDTTLAKLRTALQSYDPFALAGLQTLSSLATSFCIGMEALQTGADPAHLWQAANLEELWQEELWGKDEEARERRAIREAEFMNAFEWTKLARA